MNDCLEAKEARMGDRHARLDALVADYLDQVQARLDRLEPPLDERLATRAARLLSPDRLVRRVDRLRLRLRSEQVDDFGADPKVEELLAPLIERLYRSYFRVSVEGIEHVPAEGRCLLVANRSGLLPWDSLMIKTAVALEHPAPRQVRWLVEDQVYNQPFLGTLIARLGGVRACQEHARRLLAREALVCVFPEGAAGATKLVWDRYRLRRFGRGGYVRLSLRTQTPIVPVAVIGAEEAHPVIAQLGSGGAGKLLGGAFFPVTPTFPALGLLGLIPAPTKWTILFGEPMMPGAGSEAADDLVVVSRLNERVRTTLQTMVSDALARRRSVLFGELVRPTPESRGA